MIIRIQIQAVRTKCVAIAAKKPLFYNFHFMPGNLLLRKTGLLPLYYLPVVAGIAFSAFTGWGQNAQQKALLRKIETTKPGVEKVNLLSDLSDEYNAVGETEKAAYYGNKALNLAKSIGDSDGMAMCYTGLGHVYSYKDNPKALAMYRKSLQMHKKLGHEKRVADAYVNVGNIYDDMSKFSKSLNCYNYALRYGKRVKDWDLLADVYHNIGITNYAMGNYPESLKMLFEALKLSEKLNNDSNLANEFNSIGNVYAEQGKYDQAREMYDKSLKLCTKSGDKDGIGMAYSNIGAIYKDQHRYPEAVRMLNKALDFFLQMDDKEGLTIVHNDLAKIYYQAGKYDLARENCNKALEISAIIGEVVERTNANITLARVSIRQKKLDEAEKLLNLALQQSTSIGYKLYIKDAYSAYIQLDSVRNDYKSAFEHQKLWLIYRDSIHNQEAEEKSYQTVLKYAYDKKAHAEQRKHDKAIYKLNEQNKLNSQQKWYLSIILVVFVLSALVVWYFASRSMNNRKRLAEVLANENAHKEALLQEVHHRVNNSLQMISSLLSIQADTTESEEIREYLTKSENRIQAMSVMHQLLHLGNSKLEVNLRDYFSEVLQFYHEMLESRPGIQLSATVPSLFFHTKLAMPLALILNELITNSLKYAFPDNVGEIDVLLEKQTDNLWLFRVKDNGIGFQSGASGRAPSSIGLNLVELMARQIDGKLKINSTNGMLVEIEFRQ